MPHKIIFTDVDDNIKDIKMRIPKKYYVICYSIAYQVIKK